MYRKSPASGEPGLWAVVPEAVFKNPVSSMSVFFKLGNYSNQSLYLRPLYQLLKWEKQ